MIIQIYENNSVRLTGRITRINPYADNAANVVVAIDAGLGKDGKQKTHYISLKSFKPDEWGNWTVGMKVTCYGHLSPNNYEKDGKTEYGLDVILDSVIYGESKEVIANREAIKAANK